MILHNRLMRHQIDFARVSIKVNACNRLKLSPRILYSFKVVEKFRSGTGVVPLK